MDKEANVLPTQIWLEWNHVDIEAGKLTLLAPVTYL